MSPVSAVYDTHRIASPSDHADEEWYEETYTSTATSSDQTQETFGCRVATTPPYQAQEASVCGVALEGAHNISGQAKTIESI